MSDDVLTEVPREQVPQVLAEMKAEWPRSMVAYNIVSNAYTWEAKEPEKTFHVLRPSSPSLTGIFVVIIPYQSFKVSLWAAEGKHTALEDLLTCTHWIDWHREALFAGLDTTLHQVLVAVLRKKGVAPLSVGHCTAYWMPACQAAALQPLCLPGTYFGPLDETYAELVNSRWTYGTPSTLSLVQDIVRLNPCWGVFVSDSGQLAAWCLTAEYGVGMLRTEEQHRRRGYAQAVARHLFRHLGKGGVDIHLHIEKSNAPAHRLFHELGCLPMGDVYWSQLTAQ